MLETRASDRDSEVVSEEAKLSELIESNGNVTITLSETERLVLSLFDQLEEIELETSLNHALTSATSSLDVDSMPEAELDDRIAAAEREVLEARAAYLIRAKVIQNVLITDPILKAVHGGSNATRAEKRLLPLVNARDVLSLAHGNLATKLSSLSADLMAAERANMVENDRNRALASELFEVLEATKGQSSDDIRDAKIEAQISAADAAVRASRRRWRVMKDIVSSVIVGSGVDWAGNDDFRELVMDEEG